MERPIARPALLFLAPLVCLLWLPRTSAQAAAPITKIECHLEAGMNTSARILKVFNQTHLQPAPLNCEAPLNSSSCHIVYNIKGRANVSLGCGNCSSVSVSASQLCDECNSTMCNFDKRNATTFPGFFKKKIFDEYKKCQSFDGNEPSNFKSATALGILCTGNDLDKWCVRSFYLDKGVKKLFIGCHSDCVQAVKGKTMSDGTGREARCSGCVPEDSASSVLVKDACVGPPSAVDTGPASNLTGSVIRLGDKPPASAAARLAAATQQGLRAAALLVAALSLLAHGFC